MGAAWAQAAVPYQALALALARWKLQLVALASTALFRNLFCLVLAHSSSQVLGCSPPLAWSVSPLVFRSQA
jgi:hypothetical protein